MALWDSTTFSDGCCRLIISDLSDRTLFVVMGNVAGGFGDRSSSLAHQPAAAKVDTTSGLFQGNGNSHFWDGFLCIALMLEAPYTNPLDSAHINRSRQIWLRLGHRNNISTKLVQGYVVAGAKGLPETIVWWKVRWAKLRQSENAKSVLC